jgi:hypothetical protein
VATDTKGRGAAPGLEHDGHADPIIPHAVTREVQLAQAFLINLEDPRLSWAARFEAWSAENRLTEAEAKATRAAVLRLRILAATERHRALGRRR